MGEYSTGSVVAIDKLLVTCGRIKIHSFSLSSHYVADYSTILLVFDTCSGFQYEIGKG